MKAVSRNKRAFKFFFSFTFWAYASIGYASLAYIVYRSIVDGFIVIRFDDMKYVELPLFIFISVILLLKGVSQIRELIKWLDSKSKSKPYY